jgi:hypothetical protein
LSARVISEAMAAAIVAEITERSPSGIGDVIKLLKAEAERMLRDVSAVVRDVVSAPMHPWMRAQPHVPPADVSDRDLQSTLTLAVVEIAELGEESPAVVCSVGDSPALVLEAGVVRSLTDEVLKAGVFSTATEGVIGAKNWNVVTTSVAPDRPLLIATDGVANFLTFQGETTPLGHHVATQWVRPLDQLAFIRDMNFDFPSADDDRTAVVIWARG